MKIRQQLEEKNFPTFPKRMGEEREAGGRRFDAFDLK